MPRRRRRRRRRPPSKCHLLTVEAVEKCSKQSIYLCLTLAVRPRCVSSSKGLRPILQHLKITKKREFAANKNSRKTLEKKKKKMAKKKNREKTIKKKKKKKKKKS